MHSALEPPQRVRASTCVVRVRVMGMGTGTGTQCTPCFRQHGDGVLLSIAIHARCSHANTVDVVWIYHRMKRGIAWAVASPFDRFAACLTCTSGETWFSGCVVKNGAPYRSVLLEGKTRDWSTALASSERFNGSVTARGQKGTNNKASHCSGLFITRTVVCSTRDATSWGAAQWG